MQLRPRFSSALIAAAAAAAVASCGGKHGDSAPATSSAPVASAAPALPSAAASAAPAAGGPAAIVTREGSVVARSPSSDVLFVADEDHGVVRVIPLPLDAAKLGVAVKVPGAPAQVIRLGARVLVTVRDPGLLLTFERDAKAGLVERARVELPADAWGVALTPDGATAIVSSAWTHMLTAIDLATSKVRWSVSVAREPRGVVVAPDGKSAYVTHVVGSGITHVLDLDAAAPTLKRVELPPSPLRAPAGKTLDASLGYSAVMSPAGDKLFVARNALGAMGKDAWFGAATVDVLTTPADAPLAPRHVGGLLFLRADKGTSGEELKVPGAPLAPFTQPRAVVYRKGAAGAAGGTLLVVGEGDDRVVELDATSTDPTLAVLRTIKTGTDYDPNVPVAAAGGAPSGIALSADEGTAWVFCRSTYDVVELALDDAKKDEPSKRVRVADDDLEPTAAAGRRLFYNATDKVTSGGLACNGCHPEGRDDGHVWHEAKINTAEGVAVNFLGEAEDAPDEDHVKGSPRRTPILAGRVRANGPYGWHAESPTLESRLESGFGLHRWSTIPKHDEGGLLARAARLAAFLRQGLVPPPHAQRPLTPEEERGKAVFTSEATQCIRCHVPASEYTDRTAYPMKFTKRGDFDEEERIDFKVPSLLYVGGHGALFHDGSASSLEQLVNSNGDRMGKTNQLSLDDKAALVAFLKTL